MLQGIHAILAVRAKNDIWLLSDAEAKRLDKAIKQVTKHYPVNVSQKQLDIGFAIYAAAEIYGPRVIATMAQRKEAAREPATGNVIDFNFPGAAPAI